MKKLLIGLLLVLMVVLLTACGKKSENRSRFFSDGYIFSLKGYVCQNIDKVQEDKTTYWQTNERTGEETLYILEDNTPVKVDGLRKFVPGWYLRDTTSFSPGMAGPWNSKELCIHAAENDDYYFRD